MKIAKRRRLKRAKRGVMKKEGMIFNQDINIEVCMAISMRHEYENIKYSIFLQNISVDEMSHDLQGALLQIRVMLGNPQSSIG